MNKEVFNKVSKCSSVDEVLELARANGKNVTREQAERAYSMTHNEGELNDDDISSVAGGAAGCAKNNYENVYWATEAEVQFIFNVGDHVEVFMDDFVGNETQDAHVYETLILHDENGYYDVYRVDAGIQKGRNLSRDSFEK